MDVGMSRGYGSSGFQAMATKGREGVIIAMITPLLFFPKSATIKSMKNFVTENSKQTQKLGALLAEEIKNGGIICLEGDLGSGKTTFTQGLLGGLKVKGPYTSPTFVIMKKYNPPAGGNIFHFDAYRIKDKDILNLGWEELIADPRNIIIIEWADRIKKIVPGRALWIKFEWLDQNKRKILIK